MTRSVPVSMPSTPPQLLRAGVAPPPQGKGRAKLPERHTCCVPAALGNAFPISTISLGKRLDQLSEEAWKSGDQQLHTVGHCGTHEGLPQKRGVDRHLCCIGEQLGRLSVDRVSPVFLFDTGIVYRIPTELNNTDCSCHVFLIY